MPIYAYKCDSCGFAKDVLQKMSDAQLTQCPSCGAPTFKKQLTAAGFQLKGSGWYATDFKDGGKKPAAASGSGEDNAASGNDAAPGGKPETKTESKSDSNSDGKSEAKSDSKAEIKKADAPVAKKPDAAPAA
jgi:putative FmdB family regulatory protein